MSENTNADMIEYWNGPTGQKWVRFQEQMDRGLKPLGHTAMDAAMPMAGRRVIDVGCGCGDTSFDLADRVGADGHVFGVDISLPMLARAKARMGGRKTITFAQADAQDFQFPEPRFDLVYSRFGVMFFVDPVAAFRNLRTALTPSGQVAFVCWRPAAENPWVKIPLSIVSAHVPLPAPSRPDEPGEFAFADDARVRRILTDAGFADVNIARHDSPIVMADGGLDGAVELLLDFGPTGRAIAAAEASDTHKSRIAKDLRDGLKPYVSAAGVVMDSSIWVVTARAP